jgi:hypothetical protein
MALRLQCGLGGSYSVEERTFMSSVERLGIGSIILSPDSPRSSHRRALRFVVEMALPVLLGLVYVAVLFLGAQP